MSVMTKAGAVHGSPTATKSMRVVDARVMVDGIETQYLDGRDLDREDAPVLLLIHGHEQSAHSWRWAIPALARTHRVVAVSLPGHGETDPAPGGYAPGHDLAPFVARFLDAIGVGSVHVAGNSIGGAVALRLALADPERLRTLTLVDSAGLGRGVHPLLAMDTLPGVGELAIMISRMPGGHLGRSGMSAAMLFAQPWRVPTEFFAEQRAVGRRPGQLEASTAMARALFDTTGQREVLLDELPSLRMPVLVIWGANDYVLPVQHAHAAVHRLPNARLSVFPDCGHLPHVEHPGRFATVLGNFLAEQPDLLA